MSRAMAATLPIGPAQIFWNDVRLGSPKTTVTIRYTKNSVIGRVSDNPLEVIQQRFGEVMEIDVLIADFKIDQLRRVYDQAESFESADTLKGSPIYDASTSTVMLFGPEEIRLVGTTPTTVKRSSFDSGTVQVFKSDYSTQYTQGTDFTATASTGNIARIGAGGIADPETVLVYYEKAVTVEQVQMGGRFPDFEAPLRVTHELQDGKFLEFFFHRAQKMGGTDIQIQTEAEFAGTPMTFKILGKLDETPGTQLGRVLIEA